jgi:hypothetical protein
VFECAGTYPRYVPGRCVHDSSFSGAISYFNPVVDILYIGANSEDHCSISEEALKPPQEIRGLEKLRFLGCEFAEVREAFLPGLSQPQGPLFFFPSLEEFILASNDYNFLDISNGIKRPHGQIEWFEPPIERDRLSGIESVCKRCLEEWEEEAKNGGSTSPLLKLTIRRIARGGALVMKTN